jgi:hypothetical protein
MKKVFAAFIVFAVCISPLFLLTACSNKNDNDDGDYIYYSQYGAVGNGIVDDFDAIIKTHEAANEQNKKVRADNGKTYYIGGANKTAIIKTNTDWGNAKFIIDDRTVENRAGWIFQVETALKSKSLNDTVKNLKKGQKKIDITLDYDSLVLVKDNTTKQYIRYGVNADSGLDKLDMFLVDKNGNIDENTPILWDFDNISTITAFPIDREMLTINGGYFTTIANNAPSDYMYYSRGIRVYNRSNVIINGLYHDIIAQGEHGRPYSGFINIFHSANNVIRDCILSGHKVYKGDTVSPGVSQGTYDLTVQESINTIVKDCTQTNDIDDSTFWGIFASNYSKNITFDGVKFSRFDAHKGVYNATIKNSVLGHINTIGHGELLIENTEVRGTNFINFRDDYGSTWDGNVTIRNCTFIPKAGAQVGTVTLFNGRIYDDHDFGYPCKMPQKIIIDGLTVKDTNTGNGYTGVRLFADFNPNKTSNDYVEQYPYAVTKEVSIRNLVIESGKGYIKSTNEYMFANTKITDYKPPLSVVVIIFIITGCIAAVGGAGFAVYWFFIRNKDKKAAQIKKPIAGIKK